ncbi:hypothetical protein WHI96_01895 [Pseudonocardia tropica]|uniref:Uncharacterized protein n=1 Tax=Pseudonocardia tropica TaxID=681289 RepID=A0ABV1JNP5_9PSEU
MRSTVRPVLRHDDPGAAARSLVDAAGFTSAVVVRGDVGYAELTRDGGTVLLGGTRHDDGVHAGPHAGAVYVACRSDDEGDLWTSGTHPGGG